MWFGEDAELRKQHPGMYGMVRVYSDATALKSVKNWTETDMRARLYKRIRPFLVCSRYLLPSQEQPGEIWFIHHRIESPSYDTKDWCKQHNPHKCS